MKPDILTSFFNIYILNRRDLFRQSPGVNTDYKTICIYSSISISITCLSIHSAIIQNYNRFEKRRLKNDSWSSDCHSIPHCHEVMICVLGNWFVLMMAAVSSNCHLLSFLPACLKQESMGKLVGKITITLVNGSHHSPLGSWRPWPYCICATPCESFMQPLYPAAGIPNPATLALPIALCLPA